MAIELVVMEKEGMQDTIEIDGVVAHFGRNVPQDKRGIVTLHGENIADHHGKIFYAYNAYHYANLTALPTIVHRGVGFSSILDPLAPQCVIFENDLLQLGSATVSVAKLELPDIHVAPVGPGVTENLPCRFLDCERCKTAQRRRVVRLTSHLLARLLDYTYCPEILRESADWLAHVFLGDVEPGASLKLGHPEAIAIRPAPLKEPLWEHFDMTVERGVANREATVESLEKSALSSELFDAGRAFRFRGRGGRLAGIGAGILHEPAYGSDVPRASHFVLAQYPAGEAPPRDAVCVLHHFVSMVSGALTGVQAKRLRQQWELERRGALESQELFHDMKSHCGLACNILQAIHAALPHGQEASDQQLGDVQKSLEQLGAYIERGRDVLEAGRQFRRQLVDVRALADGVLARFFDDSPSLRQTLDWQVTTFPPGLASVVIPGDALALDRILTNLVTNAWQAVGRRGPDLLVMRLHVLLDRVERDGLPYLRVRVADDGTGLDEAARQTIFGPRFPDGAGVGHGLGSLVVADFVRRHHGFIEVASTRNVATVIGILLPAPADVRDPEDTRWIAPYRERYGRERLVSRREDLRALVQQAGEGDLGAWVNAQGRQSAGSQPCGF